MLRLNSAPVERFGSDWKENSAGVCASSRLYEEEHALRRFTSDARALRRRGKCSTVLCLSREQQVRCVDDS